MENCYLVAWIGSNSGTWSAVHLSEVRAVAPNLPIPLLCGKASPGDDSRVVVGLSGLRSALAGGASACDGCFDAWEAQTDGA